MMLLGFVSHERLRLLAAIHVCIFDIDVTPSTFLMETLLSTLLQMEHFLRRRLNQFVMETIAASMICFIQLGDVL